MTATDSFTRVPQHPAGANGDGARSDAPAPTPWLLGILCVLIGVLPSHSVLPGPLKSNGAPATLIALILFGVSVLGLALTRRDKATRTMRPGVVLIMLYFLLNLAVYGVGISHRDNTALVEGSKTRALIWLVATVGVALYTMTRIRTVRQRTIVLGCLAVGLTFACFVAVLQNATRIDLHLLLQPPGFVLNTADQGRGAADVLGERMGVVRAIGTAISPIELSVMAAATVPLLIYFARCAGSRQLRWLAWLACVMALAAIPASGSRSGVVALAAALLVTAWAVKVRHLAVAVAAGAVAIAVELVVLPETLQALWNVIVSAADDASIADRTSDYARVSETFRNNPIFGIGLGGSPPAEYGFLDNEWLQAIVQGGTFGVAAMLVLAGGGILGISAALRTARTPPERFQAYAMGAMFIAVLMSSFTFDLFSFPQATLILFVLFGLLWSSFVVEAPETRTAAGAGWIRSVLRR